MKLPYVFDLLHDIKTLEELYMVLAGEPHRTDAEPWELEILMKEQDIPFPDGYVLVNKPDFPAVVWIHKNGTYLTDAPLPDDPDEYQRMVRR